MTEREKIIQRIKKLKAHAESAAAIGSVEEANAFTLKLQELLTEYNLTEAEVDDTEAIGRDEFHNWIYGERVSYHETQTDYRWRYQLAQVLAHYNFIDFTYSRRLRTLRFYGHADNVDNVVWLYHYLSIGLLRLAQAAFNAQTKEEKQYYRKYQFLKDFLYGASKGIEIKLEEQRQTHAAANKINSLMVINNKALKKFLQAQVPDIKAKANNVAQAFGPAYMDGVKAGKDFNIGKPVEAPEKKKSLK